MPGIQHIKLSDLTQRVEGVIKQMFDDEYWIVAEISGHKFYPNNDRHYFEFVEKAEGSDNPVAKVNGRAWHYGSQHIKIFEKETGQVFTNGIEVLVKVKVEFHAVHGFSLILQDIDPSFTLGNLEKMRRDTLLRLVADNEDAIRKSGDEYITRNKKIELNTVIQHIAIIGSPNSEGYIDFVHTLTANQFGYTFFTDIYQSSVQGPEAEKELVQRLIAIYESGKKYDCVVMVRGGGAKTDFLVFDSYGLSRAAARFPIPIITGLGHHKDISIMDLMVHTSTKTPTKAAEFIISHNRNFEENVLALQKEVIIKSQQLLSNAIRKINGSNLIIVDKTRTFLNEHKEDLSSCNQVIVHQTRSVLYNRKIQLVNLLNRLSSKPLMVTSNKGAELNHLVNNLNTFTHKFMVNQQGQLNHYASVVKLVSPESILKRGFALVAHEGKIVKDATQIKEGDGVTVTMYEHTIQTQVISISNEKKDGG